MSEYAADHAECAVCFDALFVSPIAVLVSQSRRARVCRHFFHEGCLNQMPQRTCPICRVPFDAITVVPDPARDPLAWFNVVDMNGDGRLSRREVLDVLKGTLPVQWRDIERGLGTLFSQWDVDGSGFLTREEIIHPSRGLLQYVLANYPRPECEDPAPPPSFQEKARWFDHWDEDGSGALDKGEVVRALCKTFHLNRPATVQGVWTLVENVFGVFDTDGNGTISRGEFLEPEGLADAMMMMMRQVGFMKS